MLLDALSNDKSLIIELQSNGRKALGEISPLPGHSRETLAEAKTQAEKYFAGEKIKALFPSVFFGIKSAELEIENPLPLKPCHTHGLLMGTYKEMRKSLEKVAPYKILKLKLAPLTLPEALELVHDLKPHFQLRLDFNRRWPKEQIETFFAHFTKDTFEYSEEPLPNPLDLKDFPYPFALDETLRERPVHPLLSFPHLTTLILKPTLLGDITPFLSLGKKVILSHSFEGSIGREHLAKWVYRYHLNQECHGLEDPL